jgi:hypothetical protein
MKASRDAKILAILLIVFAFCDVLLSPVGFETRASAIFSNPSSLPWLGLLFAGLILNIISLILVLFRARIASILAMIGTIVYIIPLIADQAHIFTPLAPPPLIADVEGVTAVVLLGVFIAAVRVYGKSNRSS